MNEPLRIPTWYYQHFDADYSLEVPEEGFGGWKKTTLEFSPDHTALVVMHAWDCGTREAYPGWHRVVPYIPRADAICRDVFPGLLAAVRASGLTLFHVVGGGDYYQDYPGYRHALALAGPAPTVETVTPDPVRTKLDAFKREFAYPGLHNQAHNKRGFENVDFPAETKPVGDEGVAENASQLFALCKDKGINHLIYTGFAIDWCLLFATGGMVDMQRHGVMCSAIRQATTAVENKASARDQRCKELGLWRVALSFGFVFDVDDVVTALKAMGQNG